MCAELTDILGEVTQAVKKFEHKCTPWRLGCMTDTGVNSCPLVI